MLPWHRALTQGELKKHGRRLPSLNRIRLFVTRLEDWYAVEGRSFRWRRKHVPLYEAVVTEALLQRTKAETVAKFMEAFLKLHPNWESIARTPKSQLESQLKPLGLQRRRATSLGALAQIIHERGGRLPLNDVEIAKLPGVGQYVFNSIKLYRKNPPVPLLDASMARLLERFFGDRIMVDIRYDPYLQQLSRKILEQGNPIKLNWAMLDLAAIYCKPRKPECNKCPQAAKCLFLSANMGILQKNRHAS